MIKIIDGIAYENDKPIILHIIDIKPKENYHLLATFQDGTVKLYNFGKLLGKSAFSLLKDTERFNRVTLDHGVPTWEKENVDLSPETIYADGMTM